MTCYSHYSYYKRINYKLPLNKKIPTRHLTINSITKEKITNLPKCIFGYKREVSESVQSWCSEITESWTSSQTYLIASSTKVAAAFAGRPGEESEVFLSG